MNEIVKNFLVKENRLFGQNEIVNKNFISDWKPVLSEWNC